MSVILTGIGMPKSCAECERSGISAHCPYSGYSINDRNYNCKIKSLYGLIEKIENACCITVGRECDPAIPIRDVKEIIKEYCKM